MINYHKGSNLKLNNNKFCVIIFIIMQILLILLMKNKEITTDAISLYAEKWFFVLVFIEIQYWFH